MTTVGSHDYQTAKEKTVTTTGNIDDLNLEGAGLLRMNNASLATIRGFAAGYAGQEVAVVSIGAGQVDLAHQNAGSVAGSRLVNYATSGNTSLAAGVGVATYRYDQETARWRLKDHCQGAFISQAYAAGDFTAGGAQTWTVDLADVTAFKYYLSGRLLQMDFYLLNTSVGGVANAELRIAVPGGFTIAHRALTLGGMADNAGGADELMEQVAVNGNVYVSLYRFSGANWSAAVNNTNAIGSMTLEIT